MKRILFAVALCAAMSAQAQTYDGPYISASDLFPVNASQPQGSFCMVNGTRRVNGEVVNATKQVISVMPPKVPVRPRCRADSFKHGDTIVMFTTRTDSTATGESKPVIYVLSNLYGCRTNTLVGFVCNTNPKALTIDAVPVPPVVVPPPVVEPPVVTPPPAAGVWERIVNENQAFTVPANTRVRFGRGDLVVEKTVSGAGMCTFDFFGSDPAPGQGKFCDAWR